VVSGPKALSTHIIIKGKYKREDVLIPRIPMTLTDLPFDFKCLHFPVRLDFAMTINKSQGQSLEVCGINLEFLCFSHGHIRGVFARRKPVIFVYLRTTKQNKKYSLSESFKLINRLYHNILDVPININCNLISASISGKLCFVSISLL